MHILTWSFYLEYCIVKHDFEMWIYIDTNTFEVSFAINTIVICAHNENCIKYSLTLPVSLNEILILVILLFTPVILRILLRNILLSSNSYIIQSYIQI